MKSLLFRCTGVFFSALLVTQCQQPRQSVETSSAPGAKLFEQYCSRCHLGNGSGGPAPGNGISAPDIRQFTKSPAEIELVINNGFGQMPAFKDTINAADVPLIAMYVASQIEYHSSANDTTGPR